MSRAFDDVLARYRDVRAQTVALASPLSADDQLAQSMPDASPTKWHLGHTTWFFEKMILEPFAPGYRPHRADADFAFNSYYESLGDRRPRAERSLSTRPTLEEVHAYRRAVDEAIARLPFASDDRALHRLELGLQHEQQHQELVLTGRQARPRAARHPLCNPRRRARARRARTAVRAVRRGPRGDRRGGGGLLLRQRAPQAQGLARSVRDRLAARDRRRVARLHRCRRLRGPRVVALGRVGGQEGPRMARAALLEAPQRVTRSRLDRDDDDGHAPGIARLSRLSRQLLRGRRVCPLVRREVALGRRSPGACLRGEATVDGQLPRERARPPPREPAGRTARASPKRSGMYGSGPRARTRPIRASSPSTGPSPSTTASSCATSSSCAAGRASRQGATCAPRTGISSRPTRAGRMSGVRLAKWL